MKVHVVSMVCSHPDTRVDHGAEIKEVLCVLKKAPTEKERKALLTKKLKDDDIERSDRKLYWTEVTETSLL